MKTHTSFIVRSVTLLLGIFASVPAGYSWGDLGHESVAIVAWNDLTPKAQSAVSAICQSNPDIFHGATGVAGLERGATWPDEIRFAYRKNKGHGPDAPLQIFGAIGVTSASLADNLHYADYKVDGTVSEPHGRSAIAAINLSLAVLRDSHASDRAKGEALAYLTHCVGDLHQPLHAGNAKDLGGNNIDHLSAVNHDNKLVHGLKLHGIWDGFVFESTGLTTPGAYYTSRLKGQIDKALKKEAKDDLDPTDWAKSSHALALQYAYTDEKGNAIKDKDTISAQYIQRGLPIAEKQVELAGLRLALLLNQALGH